METKANFSLEIKDSPTPRAIGLDDTLTEILKCLKSQNLLILRTVCKQWNGLIKNMLRKRRNLVLSLSTDATNEHARNKGIYHSLRANPGAFVPKTLRLENRNDSLKEGKTTYELYYRSNLNHDGNDEDIYENCPVVSGICHGLALPTREHQKITKFIFTFGFADWGFVNVTQGDGEPLQYRAGFPTGYLIKLLAKLSGSLENLVFQTSFAAEAVQLTDGQDFPSFKSLTKLIIPEISLSVDESKLDNTNVTELRSFFRNLILSAPKLQSIEFADKEPCAEVIKLLHETDRLDRIVKLKMEYLPVESIPILLNSRMTLQHLNIWETSKNSLKCTRLLQKLLEKVGKTLKVLFLDSCAVQPGQLITKLPVMPLLTRLGLRIPHRSMGFYTLKELNLPRDAPNVKTLELFSNTREEIHYKKEELHFDISLMEGSDCHFPASGVTELIVNCCISKSDCTGLIYLGNLCPNVRILSVRGQSKYFFSKLSTIWGNLEELTVEFLTLAFVEGYLFGMSLEWIKEAVWKVSNWDPEWWKNVEPQENETESLISLKKLRNLTIRACDSFSIRPRKTCLKMSILSVVFGLAKMDALKTLHVSSDLITQEILELLHTFSNELDVVCVDGKKKLLKKQEIRDWFNELEKWKDKLKDPDSDGGACEYENDPGCQVLNWN